jgi:hypothetical protein
MRLNDIAVNGEELFECDRCRIRGERRSFAVQENGTHFCLSCWLENEQSRINARPVTAGF